MPFSQISAGDTSLTAPKLPLHEQHEVGSCEGFTPPLVSVVIPCYNSARYLAETIESVLAQTHPRVEIILIDDGSTDATAKIAQGYPVNYIFQTNGGISAARNNGFLHSQGKYVLFLDHDDRLLPRGIEAGVKLLEAHPDCAIAVGEHKFIGPDGTEIGYSHKHSGGHDHYRRLLAHNFIETPCSVLHRRSSLEATGIFDENVMGAEDYELYLRIARQSALITHDAPVAEYRLHDSNTSGDAERMFLVSLQVLQMELPYLQGDAEKLRMYRQGIKFVQREFGRRLTRELIGNRQAMNSASRRKLKVLRRHYRAGFAAVVASRVLPASLTQKLIEAHVHPHEHARSSQPLGSLSPG
jgi:glycosyltransferase involved in cell wall biosynthesis